jgi:hypothetical protein
MCNELFIREITINTPSFIRERCSRNPKSTCTVDTTAWFSFEQYYYVVEQQQYQSVWSTLVYCICSAHHL